MLVLRRLGATTPATATATNLRLPSLETTRAMRYYAPTPGDVQVLTPTKPTAPTPTVPPPKTTPAPTSTPDTTGACNMLWNQLIAEAPDYVKSCITYPTHKRVFDQICASIGAGATTLEQGAAQWSSYVSQHCPPPQQTPPPPPARQTTPQTPPSSSTTPPTTIVTPSSGPGAGGDSGGSPDTAPKPWELRQIGSIVGIGLLLAMGLTYARKKGILKKLTRRRR